jgi:ubiquinone/menaquinone biosynthesis C-methylase UbiE
VNPAAPICGAEQNPNLASFERLYRRRVRMPLRLNFELQTKLAMFRRLARLIPPLPPGARVLDLGFGHGFMLFWFPRHCELGGVDLTPAAVEQISRTATRRGYLRSRFERLNLDREPLPWDAASVDVLICSHVIEHVADDRRLLAEFRRVLKPGGHLILMVPIHETDQNANPLHVRRYTEDALKKLLSEYDLRVEKDDRADTLYQVFDWLSRPQLPRLLDTFRGKGIAVLGALSVLLPPLWSLRCWGLPRDYGVLAVRDSAPQEKTS